MGIKDDAFGFAAHSTIYPLPAWTSPQETGNNSNNFYVYFLINIVLSSLSVIEIKRATGLPGNKNLIYCIRGGRDQIFISGTYLPKEFIQSLATWISNDFYDKVRVSYNDIYSSILAHFLAKFHNNYKDNIERLREEIRNNESEMEELRLQNEKYKKLEEDIAFKTVDKKKHHAFALIRTNDNNSDYSFYVVRKQKLNYNTGMKSLKRKFPEMETILEFEYNPNSINFFNRIKEQVDDIDVKYNKVRLLNGYTEEEFINKVREIANVTVNTMTT
ncbi:unnamed protein product [Larinioides sclopetarius]|uniref:DUF3627 domain-containing protein n=1 Tax=Larinioides sclopetarius TaxID=280406 RepID=A0AAV1ZGB5_9ARAC